MLMVLWRKTAIRCEVSRAVFPCPVLQQLVLPADVGVVEDGLVVSGNYTEADKPSVAMAYDSLTQIVEAVICFEMPLLASSQCGMRSGRKSLPMCIACSSMAWSLP
jgi:hypothetical protein